MLDEQFAQLQELEDESSPGFVRSLVDMYKEECVHKFDKIEQTLREEDGDTDWNALDAVAHQLKGSSASIGAPKTSKACAQLREAGGRRDRERCKALMKEIRQAFQEYIKAAEQLLDSEEEPKKPSGNEEDAPGANPPKPSDGSPDSKEAQTKQAPPDDREDTEQEAKDVPQNPSDASNPSRADAPDEEDLEAPKGNHENETQGKEEENKST